MSGQVYITAAGGKELPVISGARAGVIAAEKRSILGAVKARSGGDYLPSTSAASVGICKKFKQLWLD